MEGFSHVIGSTRFHGTYSILNLCIASHYDKRQVGIGLSDMLEQYQSVMVGQAQVGKNQMECIAGSHRFDGSATDVTLSTSNPFFLSQVCIIVPNAKSSSTINILFIMFCFILFYNIVIYNFVQRYGKVVWKAI